MLKSIFKNTSCFVCTFDLTTGEKEMRTGGSVAIRHIPQPPPPKKNMACKQKFWRGSVLFIVWNAQKICVHVTYFAGKIWHLLATQRWQHWPQIRERNENVGIKKETISSPPFLGGGGESVRFPKQVFLFSIFETPVESCLIYWD